MAAIALLGSGEFLPWARPVDLWLAESSTGSSDRALVIPLASAPEGPDVYARWAAMGSAHYAELGLTPEVLPLRTRDDAFDAACVDAVADARLIFFSGGNPGYLTEALRDTPFWEAVVAAVAAGTAFGGCSAGAVAIGTLAPFIRDEMIDHWVDGLRLLDGAFIAPHFDVLDSYAPNLRNLIMEMSPPGSIAIGIDEDTALYGDDGAWQVAGVGSAWFAGDDGLVPVAAGATSEAILGLTVE